MDITIQISDEQFESLRKEAIDSVPKEAFIDAIIEGLKIYMSDKKNVESLLITKQYYDSVPKPTDFLLNIINKSLTPSNKLNEMRDNAVKHLEDNFQEIFINAFAQVLLRQTENYMSSEFNCAVENIIHRFMAEKQSRN